MLMLKAVLLGLCQLSSLEAAHFQEDASTAPSVQCSPGTTCPRQGDMGFSVLQTGAVEQKLPMAEEVDDSIKEQAAQANTEEEKTAFLKAHNLYRCMHGVDPLTWSDDMAQSAKKYIGPMTGTNLVHSPDHYLLPPPAGPAGENLYGTTGQADPAMAVAAWYNEVNDCKGGPTSFQDGCMEPADPFKMVGHFTAMIWAGAKTIGCAFSDDGTQIICRYKGGDTLGPDTPNMRPVENYVKNVPHRIKTETECQDSGSKRIDYKNCVPAGSRGKCETCTHDAQCQGNMFCCPFMKKCVIDGSTGCYLPIAFCYHYKTSPTPSVDFTCDNPDFPTTWLGKTCGAGGWPKIGRMMWATHPNKCMDVSGGSTKNGNNILLWDCVDNNPNQQFEAPSTGTGPIQWATHPNKCIDVDGGGTWNGNNILLWDCVENNPNQQFTVPSTGTGPIQWASHPNKCIDVDKGATWNGNNILLWDCVDNNPNQQFTVP